MVTAHVYSGAVDSVLFVIHCKKCYKFRLPPVYILIHIKEKVKGHSLNQHRAMEVVVNAF